MGSDPSFGSGPCSIAETSSRSFLAHNPLQVNSLSHAVPSHKPRGTSGHSVAHQPAPPGQQREAGPPARIMVQAAGKCALRSCPQCPPPARSAWQRYAYSKGAGNPSPRKPEGQQEKLQGAEPGQMMQIPVDWNFTFLKSPAILRPVQLLSNPENGLDTLNSAPRHVHTPLRSTAAAVGLILVLPPPFQAHLGLPFSHNICSCRHILKSRPVLSREAFVSKD